MVNGIFPIVFHFFLTRITLFMIFTIYKQIKIYRHQCLMVFRVKGLLKQIQEVRVAVI